MIRLSTGRASLFGALLMAGLILFLPLRLVLGAAGVDAAGLTARRADGSVWAGTLTEASAAGLRLGDLNARLSPLQLLLGRARVALASRDQLHPLHGALTVSRHSTGADGVTATIPAGAVFAPLPVTALDLDDVSATFTDGLCDHAAGRVRATLAGDVGGVRLAGVVSGEARCDAGALVLPLGDPAGTERVELRVRADGRYTARLAITPTDPTVAGKLAALGFQPQGGAYRLSVEGHF